MRENFPPDSPWPFNAIVNERIPPGLDFLINRLATLTSAPSAEVLETNARHIRFAIAELQAARQGDIMRRRLGADQIRGIKKNLEHLRQAARAAVRDGNLQAYYEAWAAVAAIDEARRLVWPINIARNDVKAKKFVQVETSDRRTNMIGPRPDDETLLPRLNEAIRKLAQGRREMDSLATELGDAIRVAFRAVTDAQDRHRLKELTCDIDRHFKLGIYSTRGSRHLERLLSSS